MSDFVPTFWNTLTQYNGKSRTSRVSAGQVAYKKRGYAWGSIGTDVESDFTATKFPGSIQFPRNAQDWLDAEFNGEYSAKRQITEGNWSNSEDAFVMRMRADCPTNSTGIIHPDKPWQVIYYNAFGQGQNLIYGHWHGKVSRLEHVIEITEMPSGDSEYLTYDFYIQSNDATTFVGQNFDQRPWAGNSGDGATVQGFDVFLAKGDDPATIRGAILRKPVCWWTNLDGTFTKKNVRVDVVIQPDGITVKATKYILRADIAEALAQGSVYRADVTFNPDPDPETTSVDGHTQTSISVNTWATLIAANATAHSSTDTIARWEVVTSSGTPSSSYTTIYRPHFLFDTSSIGAGQQVDSATLTLTCKTVGSGTEFDSENVNIYSTSPVSNTAIANGDHNNVGTVEFATAITMSTIRTSGVGVKHTWILNSDGKSAVDAVGISKFSSCFEVDRNAGTPPTPALYATYGGRWASAEDGFAGATTDDPLLTVTHSAAGPAIPVIIHHLKQQGIA